MDTVHNFFESLVLMLALNLFTGITLTPKELVAVFLACWAILSLGDLVVEIKQGFKRLQAKE